MKKAYLLISILFFLHNGHVFSGDTIRVMHYNLMNFGNFTDYCTLENNPPSEKVSWLKTLVDHYLPHVLTVNELGTDPYYQNLILEDVLNTSGRNDFLMAAPTNYAGSDIINMLYYRNDFFGLAGQDVIYSWLRDINVYRLFSTNSVQNGIDTAFLYCIVAHFKAGSDVQDMAQRAQMAEDITDYIQTNNITHPCLLLGDLNLQHSTEQAWTNLTVNSDFNDPAAMEGWWHNNPDFSMVHSQSTHTESDGCHVIGGMDDRFDFILTNSTIQQVESKIKLIPGSYQVPGQDGQRLNNSLINPPNYSAPANVIDAMYQLSDHLPVMVDLEMETGPLVPGWDYVQTMNSHILVIPANAEVLIDGAAIQPGDFMGVFFFDGDDGKCAGYTIWQETGSNAVVAYGDDMLTPQKEGFSESEPMRWKVFSIDQSVEYFADVLYDESWENCSGTFITGGISALECLEACQTEIHALIIPNGWSGISSYLVPGWPGIEEFFGEDLGQVIFLTDQEITLYPAHGIQQLQYWNSKNAYLIKSEAEFQLDVEGVPEIDKTVELHAGWNFVPVLSACPVDVEEMNTSVGGAVIQIKETAGTKIYWPGKAVYDLELLQPGGGYLICVSVECIYTFGNCKRIN